MLAADSGLAPGLAAEILNSPDCERLLREGPTGENLADLLPRILVPCA